MHIVLSTCAADPDLYASDKLLSTALSSRGHIVSAVPWNEPDVSYDGVDAVVLRANWDYHEAPQTFLRWLARMRATGVRVLNDIDLVRWNFDKRYLLELRESLVHSASVDGGAGGDGLLEVPDVHVVDQHDTGSIVTLMGKLGWEEAVLKSLSGQSGYHCHKIQRTTPEDWSEVAGAIPTEVALLQAFQPDISRYSETVFVFFLGEYSHSVRRVIAQGEWRANSRFGARPEAYSPSPGVVEQARRVLQAAPGTSPPLYARVDGIVKDDGSFTLMELELIEPALYLETDPAAAERFATAIETALATPQAL